jgi:hypothetical protein
MADDRKPADDRQAARGLDPHHERQCAVNLE